MYGAIAKRWNSIPPLSLSMAVMAGTYKKPAPKAGEMGAQSLFEDFAAGGGVVGKAPEWLKKTTKST